MRKLTPFEWAARPFGIVAAALLVFMMVHTVVAVVLRQFFGFAMLSLVEYSELVLMGVIFIAIPGALLRDDVIVVDVIDNLVPRKVSHALYLIGLLLTLAFVTVSAIAMIEPAMFKFHRTQYTMVMEIPRWYHWVPILFGFYVSIPCVAWLLIHRLRGGEAPVPPREIE